MIVMKETATEDEIGSVVEKIERAGALAHRSQGARVTIIGAIGDVEQDARASLVWTVWYRSSSPTSSPLRRYATASALCSTSKDAR